MRVRRTRQSVAGCVGGLALGRIARLWLFPGRGAKLDAERLPVRSQACRDQAPKSLPAGAQAPGRPGQAQGRRRRPSGRDELPGKSTLDTTFGANEVEKTLRVAMRTARNGEREKAAELLDQVLAVEPINREALLARGALAFDQWRKETVARGPAAAIEKAVALARSLRRAYDTQSRMKPTSSARVLYTYGQHLAKPNDSTRRSRRSNESTDAGFEAYFVVEVDEKMAELRKSPQFQAALKAHDAARLVAARERVKERLAKPVDSRSSSRSATSIPSRSRSRTSREGRGGRLLGHLVRPMPPDHPDLIDLYQQSARARAWKSSAWITNGTSRTRQSAGSSQEVHQGSRMTYPVPDRRRSNHPPDSRLQGIPDDRHRRSRRQGSRADQRERRQDARA